MAEPTFTFATGDPPTWTALVVDDEPSVRELLSDWLELRPDLEVLTAGSVAEAERILREESVTLLVTDLILNEEKSGVDIIRFAQAAQPDIVSILITAHPTVETAINALQTGAYDYLIKPFKMEQLSATVRRAIEQRRLQRENMQLREQVAVSEVIRAIGSTLEIDQILEMVVETVKREFRAAAASILLRAGGRAALELKAIKGESEVLSLSVCEDFLHGRTPVSTSVMTTGNAVVLDSHQTDMFDGAAPKQDCICQPLIAKGHTIGVLNVIRTPEAGPCSEGTLRSLEMTATQTALAIENSRLYNNLYRSYLDTVSALANAIEFRDPYTRGHTDRVKVLAQAIARRKGWGVERLFNLWMGCTLHDIGKIGVPDSILNKPGPLTEEEHLQMKRHTEIGAKMIEGVPFLRPALPYIYYHHERFDGTGYPTGLAGKEIPIEGRILAVADAFDAVTSDRPYRRGRSPEEAIDELRQCAGRQFDPEIVEALFEALEDEDLVASVCAHKPLPAVQVAPPPVSAGPIKSS
jgi:response regulator RpfG family c-di-GMP phosphodiesterase